MSKKKRITISSPCNQQWEFMTELEKGKLCSVCDYKVLDLTNCSEEEIVKHLENKSTKVCGRVRVEQLNTNRSNRRITSFYPIIQSVIASFLMTGNVGAAMKPDRAALQQGMFTVVKVGKNHLDERKPQDSLRIIRGRILDESGEPLPFVKVELVGTDIVVQTTFEGEFEMEVPEMLKMKVVVLKAGFLGYESAEFRVKVKNLPVKRDFYLTETKAFIIGEVLIIEAE